MTTIIDRSDEMENDDSDDKDLDPKAMSEAELIEIVARCPVPGLTLSRLLSFSREDWKDLEARIGTDAVRALAAGLELERRMEEEND